MSNLKIQIGCPLFKNEAPIVPKPARVVGIVIGVLTLSAGAALLAGAFAVGQEDLIGGVLVGSGFVVTLSLLFIDCKKSRSVIPIQKTLQEEEPVSSTSSSTSEEISDSSSSTRSNTSSTQNESLLKNKKENQITPSSEQNIQNTPPQSTFSSEISNRFKEHIQQNQLVIEEESSRSESSEKPQSKKPVPTDKDWEKKLPALKNGLLDAVGCLQDIQNLAKEEGLVIGEDYGPFYDQMEEKMNPLPHPNSSTITRQQCMAWDTVWKTFLQKEKKLMDEIAKAELSEAAISKLEQFKNKLFCKYKREALIYCSSISLRLLYL